MIFSAFLLGFIVSYLGSITPSMLNISAVKISVEKGKSAAKKFSLGISIVVIFQVFIAFFFLKKLLKEPVFLELIQKGATLIFGILSFYFFRKARKEQVQTTSLQMPQNYFFSGVFLSIINLFSIPFYVAIAIFLVEKNKLLLDTITIFLFSLGSFLGTYLILYHYILFADKIKTSIRKFSSYFNYILAALTGAVALISFFKML